MKFTTITLSLTLLAPLSAFATTPAAPDLCAEKNISAVTGAYWGKLYKSLVLHGQQAFARGEYDDAEKSLMHARNAAKSTCRADVALDRDLAALEKAIVQVNIEKYLIETVKSIRDHNYNKANFNLVQIHSLATRYQLALPQGYEVLKTVTEGGMVADYFYEMDTAVAKKEMTQEEAERMTQAACLKGIERTLSVTLERCKKYHK